MKKNKFEHINLQVAGEYSPFVTLEEFCRPAKRPKIKLRPNQKTALKVAVDQFISGERLGQYIEPTGGGKTLEFSKIIVLHHEDHGGRIYLVLGPYIDLMNQVMVNFNTFAPNGHNFNFLAVHSGTHQRLEAFNGEKRVTVRPTTNRSLVKKAIRKATTEAPLVIFCVYDSADIVREALAASRRKASLIAYDEAHFLSAPCNFDLVDPTSKRHLPSDYSLFFTATPTTGSGFHTMDNHTIFGPVRHQTWPIELQEQGYIVPPTLHFVDMDMSVLKKPDKDINLNEVVASLYAIMKAGTKNLPPSGEFRLLAFCENSEDHPRQILNNPDLKRAFPGFLVCMVNSLTPHAYIREPGTDVIYEVSRETLREIVKLYPKCLILQHSIFCTGTDIPNLTDGVVFRSMNQGTMIQGPFGRLCRTDPEDAAALAAGYIKPLCDGWKKASGRVWVVRKSNSEEDFAEQVKSYVQSLTGGRSAFYVNGIPSPFFDGSPMNSTQRKKRLPWDVGSGDIVSDIHSWAQEAIKDAEQGFFNNNVVNLTPALSIDAETFRKKIREGIKKKKTRSELWSDLHKEVMKNAF